jgi:undecaprenyl-diphosphatase
MTTLIIIGAKYFIILSPIIVGLYILRVPRELRRRVVIFFALSLPITYILSLVADSLYYNPRPFVIGGFEPLIPHADENGFPSNHALLTAALASGLSFFNRRWASLLWVIFGVVAFSRVYAGVHHSIDVLASALIALFVATVVYVFLKKRSSDTMVEQNKYEQ